MSRPRTLIRYWGLVPVAIVVVLFAVRACLHVEPLSKLERVASEPRDPAGTVAYRGTLHIARGGPVIIGFQSGRDGRLTVGEGDPVRGDAAVAKEMVGKGLTTQRLILNAGPVAIRFAAPPGARLVWIPVGRRGDPEYVPASSLSRDGNVDDWAGASPLDGIVGLGLLLVVTGTCVMLARHRLRTVSRDVWLAVGGILVLGCIVRWIGLSDFGETWDENVNWSAGRNYITNILALDLSAGSWTWNYEHPPVMKYLAGIGAQLADGFGPARAMSAIWMSLGCALLVPIGARLYNLRAGILAGLIATLLPHLVAHGQIVGHESPTVLWWALGILLALQARTRRGLVAVGVVIGVAVASRFVNGLLGIVCLAIVLVQAEPEHRRRFALEAMLIMPLVALVTFYVLWPRIWFDPITSIEVSFAKLSKTHSVEPFLGEMTNTPGRHYFIVYLMATAPILVVAGAFGWLARAGRERTKSALLVAVWFVVPLAVMLSPVRQDGIRYVLPCVMALAVMSAAGWEWAASLATKWFRHAVVACSVVLALYLGITLVRFQPYYLDYYSELVGGPETVSKRGMFETAWWGEGLGEAVDVVNTKAAPGARVFRNCIEPLHLAWFREDLWPTMTNSLQDADWIVAYAPLTKRCPIPQQTFERAHVVEVQGAVLAIVYRRTGR